MRAPGYPAFLAGIAALFGRSLRAITVVQAFVDVATCVLIAGIASLLAPDASRRRVAMAALWLAALCPFTSDYTAAVLTETLAIFLAALALSLVLWLGIAEAYVQSAHALGIQRYPRLAGQRGDQHQHVQLV